MNESVLELCNITFAYKDKFNYKKSFVIDSTKYKDLECCFNEIGIDINPILNKFVVLTRHTKQKCINKKLSKKKDYSIPSKLMIIPRRPTNNKLPTKGDIFFN